MRVEVRELSKVVREIDVELPRDAVSEELNRVYKDLGRKAKVPGFRPGHVPRNILERRYGLEVNRQVATRLVNSSLPEALAESKVSPIGEPVVRKEALSPGAPFQYTMRCEVLPELDPQGYFDLEATENKVEIGDEQVEEELTRLRDRHAQLRPVEDRNQVQEGDYVTLNYDATVGGQPFEGGQVRERTLLVGSGNAVPGFEEKLVGVAVGVDTELTIDLPADIQDKKIAGKPARFTVNVLEIKEKFVPDLDDDFAQEAAQVDTVAELRSKIRVDIEERSKAQAERDLKQRLVDAALEKNEFEVPQSLVEAELDQGMREAQMNLQLMGIDPSRLSLDSRKMREELRPRAERRARQRILLASIADKEEVEATDADVEERLRSFASGSGQALSKVRQRFARPEQRGRLRNQIREEKVLDLLRTRARIKDAVSVEETDAKSGSAEG